MMTKVLIINNEKDRNNLGFAPRIQQALTRENRVSFEMLHYTEISRRRIKEIDSHMIFLTGRLTYAGDVEKDAYTAELAMIRETDIPLFGICLGHQLISTAHGATLGRMFESSNNEENIREEGFVEMNTRLQDPIFNGIHNSFMAYEYHLEEVKETPKNFELLASSEMCKVQAIRHKEKPIYGVQFHPEAYNPVFPAGEMILQNFFELAKPKTIYHIPGSYPASTGYGELGAVAFE
jgi:GMP synthase-like glutamine amidotransferase